MRVDPSCTQAEVTIRTADETGPAADAVRAATLGASPDGRMEVSVQAATGPTVIQGDNFTALPGSAPIEIVAVVPPGSSLTGQTDRARIETTGLMHDVHAKTLSGKVTVELADTVYAETASGAVVVQGAGIVKAETASGAVVVQGAGIVKAQSASGDVTVKLAGTVKAETASGAVAVQEAGTVNTRTDRGAVTIDRADNIDVRTLSGDIRMGRTDQVDARSQSGDITIDAFGGSALASSKQGKISIHATDGGQISATTDTGKITVTSDPGVAERLTIQPSTIGGEVQTPAGAKVTESGQASDGARDFTSSGGSQDREAGQARGA